MTVNNNPNATPSVAVIVHRCLSSHKSPMERDQLLRTIAPPAVVGPQPSDREAVLKTVALLEDFDCLTVRDGDTIRISWLWIRQTMMSTTFAG